MTDWTGEGMAAATQYAWMARDAFAPVSPSYAALARAVAGDAGLLTRLDALPPAKRQPNLFFGALRLLGGPVAPPAAALAWLDAHWPEVEPVVLSRRTQTNEAGRCATLLPALAAVPGPLALVEIGASAGLTLLPDRYAYRWSTVDGDVRLGRSELMLHCDVTGPAPLPTQLPDVVWRRGLDLHPLDVRDEDDMTWLRALIWPEQTARFDVFDRAVAIARRDPPRVLEGDLLTDLAVLVQSAPVGATVVVYHSAVLAYVDAAARARFAATVHGLGRRVVWIANEAPGVVVDLAGDAPGNSFVLSVDGRAVARTGGHGEWLDWLTPGRGLGSGV